jgi:hypothetical protein
MFESITHVGKTQAETFAANPDKIEYSVRGGCNGPRRWITRSGCSMVRGIGGNELVTKLFNIPGADSVRVSNICRCHFIFWEQLACQLRNSCGHNLISGRGA